MSVKIIDTGYRPRRQQAQVHASRARFKVVIGHRRIGKTHLGLNELTHKSLLNMKKNPQYAYIAPTYGQAKRIAWDLLKDYTKNIPGVEVNESELRVDIPRPHLQDRIRIMLLGAENPASILGMYLDGVVFDEYGDMNPIVWTQVVRPLLSDRLGWAIFIGTPKGQNHFHALYTYGKTADDWETFLFKASETGIIPKSELDENRAIMSESEYMQEFECSFAAALVGAYYGKEMEWLEQNNKITAVPHDTALLTWTGWDLGIDDTTVIWFIQQYGREIRVIDYLESSGAGLDTYVKAIMDKPYTYAGHILPHDVKVRELSDGKSRLDKLKALGLKNIIVAPKLPVADGIEATRSFLKKCVFDRIACANGISALQNYERKYDVKNKVFQMAPYHNWASHGADGMRTLVLGLRDDSSDTRLSTKNLPRYTTRDYSVV